jgi:probable HAF family extracellular repeat protein
MGFRKLLLAAMFIGTSTLAMAQGTYTQIDYPGAIQTFVAGVNKFGDLSGWYLDEHNLSHGFLLSKVDYVPVNYPGSRETLLHGMNDKGQVTGYTGLTGFVYDATAGSFTDVVYPGAESTNPICINNQGLVAGNFTYSSTGAGTAFELSGSNYTEIKPPGADQSYAEGVDSRGDVVGFYFTINDLEQNFSFNQGTYKPLRIPGVIYPEVNGTDPMGNVLVGQYSASEGGGTLGFLYQNLTLQTLQFPTGIFTSAEAVSSTGEVVGAFADQEGNLHGFTWTPSSGEASK